MAKEKIELTPQKLYPLLAHLIKNNIHLSSKGIDSISAKVIGEAGSAKTSIIKALAKDLDIQIIELHASTLELGDLCGFPIVEHEICNEKTNECTYVTEQVLNSYLINDYKPTGETKTNYATPFWLKEKDLSKPLILLIDDYSRATPMVLQALMPIMDLGTYTSWSLPKGSTVICTSNPSEGDYIVNETDDAQNTRSLEFNLVPNVDYWALNYGSKFVDQRFCDFLVANPEIIEKINPDEEGKVFTKTNLRIWTKFFHSVSSIKSLDEEWNTVLNMGITSLGKDNIMLLHAFVKSKLDLLPTPLEILRTTDMSATIKALQKVVKKNNSLKALLTKRLYNYTFNFYKEFTVDMENNYIALLENEELLEKDLVYTTIHRLTDKKFSANVNLLKSEKLRDKILSVIDVN